ncbi:transposase [Streptomyces massasporeus]
MLTVLNEDRTTPSGSSLLYEIGREGARRMPAAGLQAEVNAYIAKLADERDDQGCRLVVRNGCHQLRRFTTAAGVVEVKAPWVNDRGVDEATGEREPFSSAVLPLWCRKSSKVSKVLPLLHQHGLSSGDLVPAQEQFLGWSTGLSAAMVSRLTMRRQADDAALHRPATDQGHLRRRLPHAEQRPWPRGAAGAIGRA